MAKRKARSRASGRSKGSPKSARSTGKAKPASRSARSGKGRQSGRTKGARPSIPWLRLTAERKLDLAGLLLLGLALFTLLSMLSPRQGVLSGAWIALLRQGFGWGALFIPLALLAGGMWLVLRAFGDRLPRLEPEQWLGAGLLYLALLVAMHAYLGAGTWDEGLAIARQGRGGGVLGAGMLALLMGALGGPGTAVAMVAWALSGLILTLGRPLPELLGWGWGGVRWLWTKIAPRAEARPGRRAAGTASAVEAAAQPAIAMPPPNLPTQPMDAPPREAAAPQGWSLPPLAEILEPGDGSRVDDALERQRARLIEETLQAFGAPARVVEINRGPVITQFGVEPDFIESRGGRRTKVKVSRIAALADDLALALAAPSIRIQAPVPGKGFVGIEVPNEEISLVALRDVMESKPFQGIASNLRIALGKDVSGRAVAADLTGMPHLLIAGTTGSGKSVCINAIIACLLLQNTPDELRFLMVDPKRVELTLYNGIPHLLAPVVVELERVVPALQWVSREMDQRYHRFSKEGVRNLEEYNARLQLTGQEPLPYLVVVIDELADLMMLAPDETERVLTRLAQLARATGIHLVIATQRPSVDVVTGLIKANFPARIAFAVASSVDSRVILDQPGAERLLGRGDMLFQPPDAAAPVRMQGAFVSEPELARLIRFWKTAALGGEPTQQVEARPAAGETQQGGEPPKQVPLWEEAAAQADRDEIFDEAVQVVRQMRRASISLLQRRLRIGYTRAARLIDQLEEAGIVGPAQGGSHAREVLDYGELESEEG